MPYVPSKGPVVSSREIVVSTFMYVISNVGISNAISSASPCPTSHPHPPSTTQQPGKMSHFEPNAILRGAQLTVVGALRALKNPGLFTSEHYKQAALAVLAGIVIRLLVAIPVRLWYLPMRPIMLPSNIYLRPPASAS
jgi:hypothetical protein